MKPTPKRISRPSRWLTILALLLGPFCQTSDAHPMPNSMVLLTVYPERIDAEIQIPLSELEAATGWPLHNSSTDLTQKFGSKLRAYLSQHVRLQSDHGGNWKVIVGKMSVAETQNTINGTYRELVVELQLFPAADHSTRHFTLYYDAVLHQVVTHKILVSVRDDWENGQMAGEAPVQVGAIALDIVNNRILPLEVDLKPGNSWTGFVAMLKLGMEHIAEGTDHLLFLLVLLLPAPLLFSRRTWGAFGGVRYSLTHLLRIVTAFTLGHSLTLLLGAMGWVRLPGQPVEILIAVSILVSAVHAWRPLFAGKEMWVAGGFGLVHGLAFASTLSNLSLDTPRMLLSILGFNLGIELMQLLIIVVFSPALLFLSKKPSYRFVRIGGALLASVAAMFWIVERAAV